MADWWYGDNANPRQVQAVKEIIGQESPLNVPAQAQHGAAEVVTGVRRGDAGQIMAGAMEAGLAFAQIFPAARGAKPVTLMSRNAKMLDPPKVAQRAFAEDYPHGARADQAGRLTHDIDGRPLTARFVVGRRRVDAADEALPAADLQDLANELVRDGIERVPQSEFTDRKVIAALQSEGRPPHGTKIKLRHDLPDATAEKALQHEIGHAVDLLAHPWGIPQQGIKADPGLGLLYHRLNDSSWRRTQPVVRPGLRTSPESFQYAKAQVPEEHMAEAIRAYLADPNYLKSEFPRVAARIREHVNSHPQISKIIQFNSAAAAVAAGAAASVEPSSAEAGGVREGGRGFATPRAKPGRCATGARSRLQGALMARQS